MSKPVEVVEVGFGMFLLVLFVPSEMVSTSRGSTWKIRNVGRRHVCQVLRLGTIVTDPVRLYPKTSSIEKYHTALATIQKTEHPVSVHGCIGYTTSTSNCHRILSRLVRRWYMLEELIHVDRHLETVIDMLRKRMGDNDNPISIFWEICRGRCQRKKKNNSVLKMRMSWKSTKQDPKTERIIQQCQNYNQNQNQKRTSNPQTPCEPAGSSLYSVWRRRVTLRYWSKIDNATARSVFRDGVPLSAPPRHLTFDRTNKKTKKLDSCPVP